MTLIIIAQLKYMSYDQAYRSSLRAAPMTYRYDVTVGPLMTSLLAPRDVIITLFRTL